MTAFVESPWVFSSHPETLGRGCVCVFMWACVCVGCVHICLHECECSHSKVYMWSSEDNLGCCSSLSTLSKARSPTLCHCMYQASCLESLYQIFYVHLCSSTVSVCWHWKYRILLLYLLPCGFRDLSWVLMHVCQALYPLSRHPSDPFSSFSEDSDKRWVQRLHMYREEETTALTFLCKV